MTNIKEIIGEDYVHSANSLFHFMSDAKYLIAALQRRALCPRYCVEDIGYLQIRYDGKEFKRIAVLEKCFCDIPLGSIVKKFSVDYTENNGLLGKEKNKLPNEFSHTDLYGEYALAFPKRWGEKKKLQPIHYLSEEADYVERFSSMLAAAIEKEDLPDEISDALLYGMCFFKPLRGKMWHRLKTSDGERIDCEFKKNFHDEHEWRYVPIDVKGMAPLLANGVEESAHYHEMSKRIETESYKETWLSFEFDDINYIIVPDKAGRKEVIESIQEIPDEHFENSIERALLCSKIVVLEDIVKDF